MKKSVVISLFIFFVVVTAVLVAGLVFYQNNYINSNPSTNSNTNNIPINSFNTNSNTNNNTPVNSYNNTTTSQQILNMAEISKHNNIDDCYMVISGKVYDLTGYFGSHPGGDRAMVPYCGRDATQGYDTKGTRGRSHSSYASSLLTDYYIGDLVQ